MATSAFAGASNSAAPPNAVPRMPAARPLLAGRTASVDPLVRRQLRRRGSVDVLVTLDGTSTLSTAKAAANGSSRALLRRTEPGYRALKAGLHLRVPRLRVLQDYQALPVQFLRVTSRAQLRQLQVDPTVIGIGANRQDTLDLTQSLPLIGQPAAETAGFTGAGTAVAVLDSGVDYTRAAFGSCSAPGPTCKVVLAQDVAPDDGMLDDPAASLHGTNVSGIVVGVAPDTKVLGLDVFDGLTSSSATQVSAINFVIAQQATYNIRAINMSLGAAENYNTSPCSGPADARVAAFANARAAGIIPVVAAGNNRFANGANHIGISRPACIPGAFPVGAVYDSDVGGPITWGGPNANDKCTNTTTAANKITCFSQVWTNPMMLAPGAIITAADVTQGGTSQATPHVAGAVAVLFEASPGAPITSVENALRNSGPSIFDSLVGQSFHRLFLPDGVSALGAGTTPPPTTTTPPPTTTTPPPTTTTPPPTTTTPPPTTTTPPPTTTTPPPTTTSPPPGTCTISGTSASERLVGTPGNDVICGSGGDDTLVPGGGNDIVIGGPGFDFVSIDSASGGGTIDLTMGTATAPGVNATLHRVEGAVGSAFNDTLIGDGGDNDFYGLGGDDTIDGAAGFDFAHYDLAVAKIRANLGLGAAQGEGADTLAAIEGIVGGPKNDHLRGDGKPNTLVGLGGGDRLSGRGKPDTLIGGPGADHLFGGGGRDSLAGGPGADTCNLGPGGGITSSC